MKLHIAICDDEKVEREYLTRLSREWAMLRKINVAFSQFNSAENFLFHYADDNSSDILMLDIQMNGMNGVELARTIRQNDNTIQIVFITGYPDFMAQGYDVAALHYLLKPLQKSKLFEVLDKAVAHLQTVPRTILIPKSGGTIRIKADEIIYAEVISHTTVLNLTNGTEEFQMRISDMELLLGEGFFRCHRSYIVSMKYVRRVTRTAMVLEDGREIPLSRNLYDKANQAFIDYN